MTRLLKITARRKERKGEPPCGAPANRPSPPANPKFDDRCRKIFRQHFSRKSQNNFAGAEVKFRSSTTRLEACASFGAARKKSRLIQADIFVFGGGFLCVATVAGREIIIAD
jgi:hypothetical protein